MGSYLRGDGDDTIVNSLQTYGTYAGMVLMVGGNGNDHIENIFSKKSTIEGGAGSDVIENGGASVTINGGLGDDRISLKSGATNNLIQYNSGDGNDLIEGFNETSTLKIGNGTGDYFTTKSGSDIIVLVGEDKITLQGAAALSKVNIAGHLLEKTFDNSQNNTVIAANDLDNTINNRGSLVTIKAEGGNDSIINRGANVLIDGGAGNDSIDNYKISNVTISGGDGNDVITGFNETSTLEISGGLHSTEKSGDDVIVMVGEGKITLQDAANIINSTYAIFTVKDSKVTAAIPQSVEGNAYQFNEELKLLTLKDNLKESSIVVRNEDDSSVKVSGSFGSAELSGTGTLEYQVDGSKNNVTLTSKTYGDKITFREDAALTYGDIAVELQKGGVVSTKGDKEISFDNNSSANVTAPEGAKININAGTFTINDLPITSTNGAGTVTVTADGLSFEGYGVQFVDLAVDMESYFGKLAPATVNYNSADKSYTIKNSAQVQTLSDDFTKLTLALGDDTQANFNVNGKEFLVANVADNLNVIEANGSKFKIQGKELDAEKIGRVTIGEQLTFSGTEIDFGGVKVNYALNKPAIYSLDGKEISISDAATVTTSDETKTFKCEAGTYVVNGRSFETSAALTFTADTNEIKLPLNDARTEIYFDGVKVSGNSGELVFDLANDKISIPTGAELNITSPEEVKLNLAAGDFTIDGKKIITDNALEITANKDSIQVPLENVVTIDEAKIIGTGAATIDNTDEYLYSILLPNGALVQNASDNTFELHGKDSFAYFGDTNKKVELTEDGTAYIAYDKENSIYVGLNALTFEQVEIQGVDAWTIETSGTNGIDKITGIKSGATITTSTEYVDAGDLRFEVETDGAGDFTICGEKFTSTDDKNIYVVRGNSNDEIKVSTLADEFSGDDSEAAGKTYQFDAAGDYTVNGITFHAEENSKVQTITRGVEFDLSSGKFEYDGLTLDGAGSAQNNRYNANLISLTDGAKVSGDETKYYNRQFEISGAVELGDKKFESNSSTRLALLDLSDTVEGTAYTLNGFIVDGKFVEIQNDSYSGVKVVDKKISSIEGVKASAEIYGNGITNVSITTTGSGEFLIRDKTFKISGDSDGVTFVTDSHGDISEINGLKGSVEGNFANKISVNGKAVRLTGASSITVTSDGTNITEISNVAGDLVTVEDKTYRKDVRVYELGGAEKLTTAADGTIIFNGNKFETSAGKTFTLDDSGNVSEIGNAAATLLSQSLNFSSDDSEELLTTTATSTENLATINLSTTDGLEEVFGDFSEGLTVNGVFVKVTDSTNFVVKSDDENVYIETTALDTFTINGKTFNTYADKTIFKLDESGNVSEIVTDNFYLYPDEEFYLVEGDFNDEIIFNGKKFCVTGTEDTNILTGDETMIGVILEGNIINIVESGGASEITIIGDGDVVVGDKDFSTSAGFVGVLKADSEGVYAAENFIGTLSGELGGLELSGLTIDSDDTFSVTGDGEEIVAVENLKNGSFTCDGLDGLTINDALIYVDNSAEVKVSVVAGEVTVSDLLNSAEVVNSADKVNFVTKESGEFFIGENTFNVTGDDSVTFTADENGTVNEISDLDSGASLQTADGGTYVVNGKTLTAKANDIFLGLANSAELLGNSTANIIFIDADTTDTQNITLESGSVVVVDETSAQVNITASEGSDSIFSAGKNVELDLTAGGATKIFASDGKMTVTGYDATTGSGFLTNYSDIFTAVDTGEIFFDNGTLTIGDAVVVDEGGNNLVNLFNAEGKLQRVGEVLENTTLDLSSETANWIFAADEYSTLVGGSGDDSIFAFAGSQVDAGAGRNYVEIEETNDNGDSTILLNGRNTIDNFNAGFDGGDKLSVDATSADWKFDGENVSVTSDNAGAILQNISSDGGAAKILTVTDGNEIRTAIAQADEKISVDNDEADLYVGKNSGVDFTGFGNNLFADLSDTEHFRGINQIAAGSGQNTLIGSDAKETLTAGTGDNSIWGAAGNDVLVGNKSANKDGATEFFFTAGDGHDTIKNFDFGTDKINVGENAVTDVLMSNGNVRVEIDSDWLTIEDAQGKDFQINDFVAKVDKTNVAFDDTANFYVATGSNATLTVGKDVETNAVIWLSDPNRNGSYFVGDFKTLDASKAVVNVELAGNDLDNTIIGGKGDASLWGGDNGNDVLIGGSGRNLFFYCNGNGSDTIQGVNDGDFVILTDISLDQITSANITADAVDLRFTDGGSLKVSGKSDVTYQLADGSKFSANHNQREWNAK